VATETIEIYAPIAHCLGMGKVRGELEDLAFRHLDPEAFEEIAQTIESKRHSNEEFLDEIRATVENELRHEGIPSGGALSGAPKPASPLGRVWRYA
jgi:GTP pyrophosphokinase